MDNAKIIAQFETELPENVLNGNYIHNGINVPLRPFLEDVIVNFISEGSTYEQVSKYIKTKILPDVVPSIPVIDGNVDLGSFENADVQAKARENQGQPQISTIPVIKSEFVPIDPILGNRYIDEFIKNRVGFVATVKTSDKAIVDTRDYLYSKVPFMNNDKKILIGEKFKTIDEVYEILLKNSYRPATLVDKTELCIFLAEELEPEIQTSIIPELNMTVRDYIQDVLPNMMINATDIQISGKNVPVDEAIYQIAKKQREMLDREQEKANNEKIEEFNRTGENPSLLSEIKLELDKDQDAIEVTAEIPIVSSYLVTPEEVTALSTLPNDAIYGNDDSYYRGMLSQVKQSVNGSSTEHDLASRESGNNNCSFNDIAQEALKKIPTFEMQQLINSTSELIGIKRNELIKVYSNREEYCDAVMTEINSLSRELEITDSIDGFSEIKSRITKITIDLVKKKINDLRIKQALEDLMTSFNKECIKYNLTQNDFEKQKNRIVGSLNDDLSRIRRSYARLVYIQDIMQSQSIINTTNISIEQLKAGVESAVSTHYLTEEEAISFYSELNRLNTLGTTRNRLGA